MAQATTAAGRDRMTETPIDPALPICDPHHHLWVHRGNYLLDEFLADTASGHNVVASVFLACDAMYREDGPTELRPVGETEFVESIAVECARRGNVRTRVAAGIVGYADLTLGDGVQRVLDAHRAASPDRFRGVRHSVTWDPSPAVKNAAPHARPGVMLEPGFRAGFACLYRSGFSFDAWMFHPQLGDLVSLARAFPDATIVLNHLGGPLGEGPYAGKRAEVLEVWKRGMKEVATCRNVIVKLGGIGMPRCGFGWNERSAPPDSAEIAAAMGPYFRFCVDHFGPQRCMFESNFPVDKASFSYGVMWNAFKRLCQDFSPSERLSLFHDTAARAYRLQSSASAPAR